MDPSYETSAAPSRRDRERIVRRACILEAARAVFAEKGYSDATLEEIAQRAEFGKGTLYNYFEGGKEELLLATVEELYGAFRDLTRRALAPERAAERPARELYRGYILEALRFFLERRDLFRILVREAHRIMLTGEAGGAARLAGQQELVIDEMAAPLERAMEAGELRKLPARGVAHAIWGNINGYLMVVCAGGCVAPDAGLPSPSPEEGADFLTTILFDGLAVQPVSSGS